MQELRIVAVSEDGSYAVLAVPGRSGRFALPIDDRLRTVARGQFSRLAQYEIEVESPLRPKEIQDRIRAGERAEEIADAAGLPVDRIKRFEGPPLAERARWAEEAQRASIRGFGDAGTGPGPRLGELVTDRLVEIGASVDDIEWDSRRRPDGYWQIQLAYTIGGRMHMVEWAFDPRSSHVIPDDDEAAKLCLGEADWQARLGTREPEVTATVTPIGVRSAGSTYGGHRQDDQDAVVHPSRRPVAEPPAALTGMRRGPAARRAAPVGAVPAESVTAGSVPAAAGETVAPPAQVTSAGQRESAQPPMRPAVGRPPERPAPSPSAQSPSAQSPSAQSPSAQSPSAQSPSAQSPSAQSPSAQSP
ncbi:MAG: septation protein SepH, partial [Streptosporangiaceae bacterium]